MHNLDGRTMASLLRSNLKYRVSTVITLRGTSMLPMFKPGDWITVERAHAPKVGEIFVFLYKGALTVHRLVKIEDGRAFLKGDNALRLEDVRTEDLIGRVTEVNGRTPAAFPPELIGIALLVNREFRRCSYNAEKAKKSDIYIQYERKIRETFPDAKGVI